MGLVVELDTGKANPVAITALGLSGVQENPVSKVPTLPGLPWCNREMSMGGVVAEK